MAFITKLSPSLSSVLIGICATAVVIGGIGVTMAVATGDGAPAAESREEVAGAPSAPVQGFVGDIRTEDFPTNSHGLTYGSSATSEGPEEWPDLIAVVGESGVRGFAYAEDILGPEVNTPAEAVAYERKLQREGPSRINIYDVEGVTVVDTFLPQLGSVSYGELKTH